MFDAGSDFKLLVSAVPYTATTQQDLGVELIEGTTRLCSNRNCIVKQEITMAITEQKLYNSVTINK